MAHAIGAHRDHEVVHGAIWTAPWFSQIPFRRVSSRGIVISQHSYRVSVVLVALGPGRNPLDSIDDSNWDLHSYACFIIFRAAPALPTGTRPPASTRASQTRPTQQPSVTPAKERAPTPNSTIGGRREAPFPGQGALSPASGEIPREGRCRRCSRRRWPPGVAPTQT